MRDNPIQKRERFNKKGITDENEQGLSLSDRSLSVSKGSLTLKNKNLNLGLSERSNTMIHKNSLMKIQRRIAPTKSMRNCSIYPISSLVKTDKDGKQTINGHPLKNPIPDITLNVNEYGSSFSGLQTCDNAFCVNCARVKAMERSEVIEKGLKHTSELGWSQYFVTLTIKRQPEPKRAVLDLQHRWRKVTKALNYYYKKKMSRHVEYVRAVDVTFKPHLQYYTEIDHGDIGGTRGNIETIEKGECYHVHLHTIIVIEGSINDNEFRKLIRENWKGGGRFGIKSDRRGQDIRPIENIETQSKYVAKQAGLGLELTHKEKQGQHVDSMSLADLLEQSPNNLKYEFIYRNFIKQMASVRTFQLSRGWKYLIDETIEDQPESDTDSKKKEWIISPDWWEVLCKYKIDICVGLYEFIYINPTKHNKRRVILFDNLIRLDPRSIGDPFFIFEEWLNDTLDLNDLIFIKKGCRIFNPLSLVRC